VASSGRVVGAGWHDTYFRWDISIRNTKTKNGGPRWGKIRFEREQRFEWKDGRQLDELGQVTRIPREVQTLKLIERVQLGEMTTAQYEQLTGFLDAERLGVVDRVYSPETARRRRKLAKSLGVALADAEIEPLDVGLDELLAVSRSAWTA
jgi:hypothetical protein